MPGKLLEVYLGLGVGEAHKGKEVIQEEVLAVALPDIYTPVDKTSSPNI